MQQEKKMRKAEPAFFSPPRFQPQKNQVGSGKLNKNFLKKKPSFFFVVFLIVVAKMKEQLYFRNKFGRFASV